jgi:pimeloyl-ACP methyl ester carboxylesterase
MAAYSNLYWSSAEGLRLHARDYAGGTWQAERPAIVCLPGLTRNARDYAALAETLAPAWRVIAVDFRGRGKSEAAKEPGSYLPATYVEDVEAMLVEAGIGRYVAIGTSLGGIVAMMLAARTPGRIAGAVLGDIGPVIESAGLARIRSHVGRASSFPTWLHAARCLAENNRDAYPGWGLAEWLAMAKRLYRVTSAGRIVLDYDLRVAEPFRNPGAEAGPAMEEAWVALAAAPVLVVRGERSDILSAATAARMAAAPGVELVTVPGIGHAPTLAEPEAAAGIARLLARVAG